jgi:hypothetical protein
MLGFSAFGTQALGELGPSTPIFPLGLPGAGKRYQKPTAYLPEPAWDVKPNKPFQPVWDRFRQQEAEAALAAIEAARQAAEPAANLPLPLPPQTPGAVPIPGAFPPALPNFNELVPPNSLGMAQDMHNARMTDAPVQPPRDAKDMNDILAVFKAIGLIGKG